VTDYRIYFVDRGGRIARVREISCASQSEASDAARASLDGAFGIELWQDATMILKLAADGLVLYLR